MCWLLLKLSFQVICIFQNKSIFGWKMLAIDWSSFLSILLVLSLTVSKIWSTEKQKYALILIQHNQNLFGKLCNLRIRKIYDGTSFHSQLIIHAHLQLNLSMVQLKQLVLPEEVVTPALGAINGGYEVHSHH